MSPKIRQYLLYALSILLLLVLTPWWYVRVNEEYVLYRRADNYYADQDFEKAANNYFLAFQKGLDDPRLLNRLGDSYLALQEFGRALEVILEMKSLMPENLSVQIKLAHVYSLNKLDSKALDTISRVLEKKPDWQTALLWKARILSQDGQFEEAIEIYRQILDESNSS